MDSKDIKDFAIIGVVSYGLFVVLDVFGKKTDAPAVMPNGWTPSPKATISISQAHKIAADIKNALGNLYNDVVAIDKALWVLQNGYDVEVLFSAFGNYDPGTVSLKAKGDLFGVLDIIRFEPCFTCSSANFDSIKAHMYNYSNNLKNY